MMERLRHLSWDMFETDLPRLARFDTRKQLAYVISDKFDEVSKLLLKDLGAWCHVNQCQRDVHWR